MQPIRWIRPPRQARSRDTLDRILDAAEHLLDDRGFDQLTLAEIVRRSRSSIGAFYARFANKEALLAALYERHQQEALATVQDATDPARWERADVAQIVRHIVRFAVKQHREKRGLLRALVLRGYTHPDPRYKKPSERERLSVAQIGALLGQRKAEIRHSDPRMAASLGFLMVLATLRETVLFGDSTASAISVSDRRLETELVRAYLAYLGVSGASKASDSPLPPSKRQPAKAEHRRSPPRRKAKTKKEPRTDGTQTDV